MIHQKIIFILASLKTSKIVAFGAQTTRKHTLKSRRTQSESLFGCGFWSRGIIGAFFFENKQGEAVTVYGDRAILNEFLFTKIVYEDIGNIMFQLDGATCHTTEATLDVLSRVFEDRIISRRAHVLWPLGSWNLTPLDYYLWVSSKISVTWTSQRQLTL